MILSDLRFAVRHLRQHPGFAALAILTLVLGLGSTTAVVTVVDNVLFRSLPYPESDRLVRVWPDEWFSKQEILDFERHARAFERDIPLPVRIDRDNVVATIRDGVLVVDLGAK